VLTRLVLWQTFVLSFVVGVNKIYMRMEDLIRFFLTQITYFPTILCFFLTPRRRDFLGKMAVRKQVRKHF